MLYVFRDSLNFDKVKYFNNHFIEQKPQKPF